VGAPLAAAFLEELIALGCRKFIACGGAGVLNREITVGHPRAPSATKAHRITTCLPAAKSPRTRRLSRLSRPF
jgi:uridine phosphorylase